MLKTLGKVAELVDLRYYDESVFGGGTEHHSNHPRRSGRVHKIDSRGDTFLTVQSQRNSQQAHRRLEIV
jgi:hypothetical protein